MALTVALDIPGPLHMVHGFACTILPDPSRFIITLFNLRSVGSNITIFCKSKCQLF